MPKEAHGFIRREYHNTKEHAKNIRNLFQSFLDDLKMFTDSLVESSKDE